MSMFSTLMGKIFSHSSEPAPQASAASATPAPATYSGPTIGGTASATATPAGSDTPTSTSTAATSSAAPAASATPAQSVDVAAILDDLQSKSSQDLNWKQSIVDMMGLLGMDNSLTARKHLATELGYTGDESDSATMNIWLHKQVMTKLAANGGKVPSDMVA